VPLVPRHQCSQGLSRLAAGHFRRFTYQSLCCLGCPSRKHRAEIPPQMPYATLIVDPVQSPLQISHPPMTTITHHTAECIQIQSCLLRSLEELPP